MIPRLAALLLCLASALAASPPAKAGDSLALVIEPRFEKVGTFSGGFAPASENGRWGIIDATGRWAVEPRYDDALAMRDGRLGVKLGNHWGYIDTAGAVIVPIEQELVQNFSDGVGAVKTGGKWQLVRKDGKALTKPVLDEVTEYEDGVAAGRIGKAWVLLVKGEAGLETVKLPGVEQVFAYSEGLGAYVKRGKRGYLDATGKTVIEPRFARARQFAEKLASVQIDGKYGYVDPAGKVRIEPAYAAALEFDGGLAPAKSDDGRWRYIKPDGSVAFDKSFEQAFGFSEGLALIKESGLVAFIDATGTVLATPDLDDAYRFSEGKAAVRIGGKWGFLGKVETAAAEAVAPAAAPEPPAPSAGAEAAAPPAITTPATPVPETASAGSTTAEATPPASTATTEPAPPAPPAAASSDPDAILGNFVERTCQRDFRGAEIHIARGMQVTRSGEALSLTYFELTCETNGGAEPTPRSVLGLRVDAPLLTANDLGEPKQVALRRRPDGDYEWAEAGSGSVHRMRVSGDDLLWILGPEEQAQAQQILGSNAAELADPARADAVAELRAVAKGDPIPFATRVKPDSSAPDAALAKELDRLAQAMQTAAAGPPAAPPSGSAETAPAEVTAAPPADPDAIYGQFVEECSESGGPGSPSVARAYVVTRGDKAARLRAVDITCEEDTAGGHGTWTVIEPSGYATDVELQADGSWRWKGPDGREVILQVDRDGFWLPPSAAERQQALRMLAKSQLPGSVYTFGPEETEQLRQTAEGRPVRIARRIDPTATPFEEQAAQALTRLSIGSEAGPGPAAEPKATLEAAVPAPELVAGSSPAAETPAETATADPTAHPGLWPLCKSDGACGYIDRSGAFVIEPKYQSANPFREGLAAVQLNGQWGFIDAKGKEVVAPAYTSLIEFKEGRGAVQTGDLWYVVDHTGKKVSEQGFKGLGEFSEGRAYMWDGTLSGYVDLGAKVVIAPKYTFAGPFREGRAPVRLGESEHLLIDSSGNPVGERRFEALGAPSEGLVQAQWGGKYGYVDIDGKTVIENRFDYGGDFHQGLAVVRSGEKYGYIDKTGATVVEPQYLYAGEFVEDRAVVKAMVDGRERYGFIDRTGKLVVDTRWDSASGFREGFTSVGVVDAAGNWTYGLIDTAGKLVAETKFRSVEPPVNGLASVHLGDRYGYIDTTGTYVGFTEAELQAGIAAEKARNDAYAQEMSSPVSETVGSCTIAYEQKTYQRDLDIISSTLGIWGVDNAKGAVLEHICQNQPGGTIGVKDASPDDPPTSVTAFRTVADKQYVGRFEVGGCAFDYEFGIEGDQFYGRNHQNEACGSPASTASTSGESSGGGLDHVYAKCEVRDCLFCTDETLTITGGPSGTQFSPGFGGTNTISNYGSSVAGQYDFSCTWAHDTNPGGCSGSFSLSGEKEYLVINVSETNCEYSSINEH